MGRYAAILLLITLAGVSYSAPRVVLGEMITNSG
jgi:hypothetical protein